MAGNPCCQDQICNLAPVVANPLYPAISPPIYPPAIEEELVRVFCKAAPEFYLTGYEDGTVAMARINVSDPHQKWVIDKSWGSKLEDAAGFPAFALINKATGRALRHGHSECDQVDSIHFKRNEFEDDILWSTSQDFGQRYRTIRMYNNIALNLDIDLRAKKHGGIKQGTRLILYRWLKDHDHQYWRIVPEAELSELLLLMQVLDAVNVVALTNPSTLQLLSSSSQSTP